MWLFVSLIPGGVGFVLFVYGKTQGRWPQMGAGLYPDFATSLGVVGRHGRGHRMGSK
jgi:hypothetical protein